MRPLPALLIAGVSASASAPASAGGSLDRCTLAVLSADVAGCDPLIAAEPDRATRARLLQRRAYALVEKGDLDRALRDLDESLRLDPDLADALHERAYIWIELRDFDRALSDLDRELALRPEFPNAYQERAFARHGRGDFGGAYQDWMKVAALSPRDPAARLHRAGAALWLGRFDEASADLAEALRLMPEPGSERLRRQARDLEKAIGLWKTGSGTADPAGRCDRAMEEEKLGESGLIGDCTTAFLRATQPSKKAGYLTIRSLAWLVGAQDLARWKEDAEAAVALDPGNGDWHANLGGVYERFGRHRQALRAFDRAVALKPGFVALAGRAGARYELGDKEGAFEDARKSFEIRPNIVALTVLGDLSNDRKDRESAKLYWMGAWQMGSRDDGLRARLRSIGIEDPEREPK